MIYLDVIISLIGGDHTMNVMKSFKRGGGGGGGGEFTEMKIYPSAQVLQQAFKRYKNNDSTE